MSEVAQNVLVKANLVSCIRIYCNDGFYPRQRKKPLISLFVGLMGEEAGSFSFVTGRHRKKFRRV